MVRCLSLTAIIGSLFCSSVWLAAAVQYFQSDLSDCQTFSSYGPAASSSPDVYYEMTHILRLDVFILLSLGLTGLFFLLFYLQLFQHDRLAHEVLLEDLAETAATSTPSHSCTSGTSFTHAVLLLFNSVVTALLALLCVLGVGSFESATREEQPPTCRYKAGLGLLPLFLDFFCCLQYFVLTVWRCVTRCIGEEGDTIDASQGGSEGPLTRGAPKAGGKKGDGKKGKGKANGNVQYSAVDADDDELFDAEALEGEGTGTEGGEGRVLAALSGSTEEEVEMMDMLDVTPNKKKAGDGGEGGAGKASSTKVPSLLPPPSVEEKREEKKEEGKAGEAEDDAEYDYGDIEEEDEDGQPEAL